MPASLSTKPGVLLEYVAGNRERRKWLRGRQTQEMCEELQDSSNLSSNSTPGLVDNNKTISFAATGDAI
jgi:hypothetical protein